MPYGARQPCPGDCDTYGARDTWLFYDSSDTATPLHMYYDASGKAGWLASLAVTADPSLRSWVKRGTLLSLGPPGSTDSASASYLTPYYDTVKAQWVGYYLGTPTVSPPPYDVPIAPYYSVLATAPASAGPWTQPHSAAIFPRGSPGPVMPSPLNDGSYWMFCTGCGASIGLATTRDLYGAWSDALPLITDEVENVSLYFEESNGLWWLFTNHIGPDAQGMAFDDAIWAYWSANLTSWPLAQKAVVLNRTNVIEPSFQVGRVGLPSVLRVPGNSTHLALLYDGGGTRDGVSYNINCSVALAWLQLPLVPPAGF